VQSQVSRALEKVPGKVWEALVQSQVRLNKVPEKVPEKGGFCAEPSQVPQGSGEGSGEGGFGAWPGQVQFRWRSGRLWCRARSGSTGFRRKFRRRPEKVSEKVWEALVQSQVTFNRVLEKVAEKVWEALVPSQVRFNRVPKKVPEKAGEGFGEGVGGFGAEPG